jgi:hypothetical protein
MPTQCRICQIIQTPENTSPSFLARGFTICRKCNQIDVSDRYKKQRKSIMQNLGMQCQCCGIMEYELLSIDHIFGNGHQEAKKLRGKKYISKLYRMSIEELTTKYQALCFNCNYTKGFYGKCPHSFDDIVVPEEYLINEAQMCNRGIKKIHLSIEEREEWEIKIKSVRNFKCKLEFIKAYGERCISCNETHPLFLILDHINNNGYLEKYKGVDFYQLLKRAGYPGKGTQLQLMCHNCNAKKEYTKTRLQKTYLQSTTAEIYISQDYAISSEHEERLWNEARRLYYLLNKSK